MNILDFDKIKKKYDALTEDADSLGKYLSDLSLSVISYLIIRGEFEDALEMI